MHERRAGMLEEFLGNHQPTTTTTTKTSALTAPSTTTAPSIHLALPMDSETLPNIHQSLWKDVCGEKGMHFKAMVAPEVSE